VVEKFSAIIRHRDISYAAFVACFMS
jgi:hypothetical protein